MPRPILAALDARLDLIMGLSAISAGFLWLWVWMLEEAQQVLCSEAAAGGAHCPLCYPAAVASLIAIAAAARTMARSRL